MRVTRKILFAAIGAIMTLGPSIAAAAEKVTMATEASFPPFSKTEADGTYTGFELDLGNEVCKRAGFECTWVKQDFDGAIAALQAKKFDIIFSSMSIKPERQKVADFSLPYYNVASAVFAKKGSLKAVPADLSGKKVGVYGGATQDLYARAHFDGAEVRPYENIDLMSADLVAGRIDAMFVEDLPGQEFLAKPEGKDFERVGDLFTDVSLGAGAGAMFRKGDPLKAKVDEALKAIYADGTFDRLSAKWFPAGTNIRADNLW
jgi:lysine-arginine-ornithine-binding protein